MTSRRPRSLFENIIPPAASIKINGITADDLANSLRNGFSDDFVVIDCRKYERFAINHINEAKSLEKMMSTHTMWECEANFSFTLDCSEMLSEFRNHCRKKFVLYDDDSTALKDCMPFLLPLVEHLVMQQLDVSLLRGGFNAFSSRYATLCSSEDRCLIRLPSGSVSDSNSLPVTSPSQFVQKRGYFDKAALPRAASMLVMSPDHCGPDFCSFLPSNILPHLYLGSEFDAKDSTFLTSQNITHVLNVTANIPCFFETRILYKRLPASDTDNENLKQYFNEASDFIDTAQQSGGKVLVHCQAGISRSPSIVLAYLIERKSMPFQDAYQLLSKRRPIIAPNFNFLAQLNEFESEVSSRRSSTEISSSDESVSSPTDLCNNLLPLPPKRCRSSCDSVPVPQQHYPDISVNDSCCL